MKTYVLRGNTEELKKLVGDIIFLKEQVLKNLRESVGFLIVSEVDFALGASIKATADLRRIKKLVREIKQITYRKEEEDGTNG